MPTPPIAKEKPKKLSLHGDTRIDPYYWLRERESKEVLDHLKKENAYTEALTKKTKALQEELFEELKSRMKEDDTEVPVFLGGYYYYSKTEKGKQYQIHCRKRGNLRAKEEIILDPNRIARELKTDYLSLGDVEVSPNQELLAYSLDTDGSELYRLYIKDLRTGKILPDRVEKLSYSIEWGNDNQTLFYTQMDKARRTDRVYRHRLGEPASKDQIIYQEKDALYSLHLSKSKDNQFIFIEIGSSDTSEIHYLSANTPIKSFKVFEPRKKGHEYEVYHHETGFYIVTNGDKAKNFKVMKTSVDKTAKKNWKNFLSYQKNTFVEGLDVLKDYLIIFYREKGLEGIKVYSFKTKKIKPLLFKGQAFTIGAPGNLEYDTSIFRYSYESPITPEITYDLDLKTGKKKRLKQQEVPNYDASLYKTERIFATSHDGMKIPIILTYKKTLKKNSTAPLHLIGYGSYGMPYDPHFSFVRFSLIDRGYVTAVVQVRGGGEFGRTWYEDGKYLKKKNTFKDFIAGAEHLIKQKYVHPKKISIQGGSAGGLLMGAVLNKRPDLFQVVTADVPFVDVLTTMLDESIPLTVGEFLEWGNPKKKTYYDYMKSYSPYDNVKKTSYPDILVTAGLNDPRVQYWEPAKWVQKLRKNNMNKDSVILLKTEMGAGHSGPSGRYNRLKDIAFDYSFILSHI